MRCSPRGGKESDRTSQLNSDKEPVRTSADCTKAVLCLCGPLKAIYYWLRVKWELLKRLWKGPACGSEKPMIPQEIQSGRVQMLQKVGFNIFILNGNTGEEMRQMGGKKKTP